MKSHTQSVGLALASLFLFLDQTAAAPSLQERGYPVCRLPQPSYCPAASVQSVATALRKCYNYSSFCSSYNHITTVTTTSTCTKTVPATTTTTEYTATSTFTAPLSIAPTVTAPAVTADAITVTETVGTLTITTCIPPNKRFAGKRGTYPTKLPACVSKYQSSAISSGCSCLCLPTPTHTAHTTATVTSTCTKTEKLVTTTTTIPVSTPTTTPTVTPTETASVTATETEIYCPAPTADQSCNNAGLQYGYFSNPFQESGTTYPTFDPEYFKDKSPDPSGVASSGGGFSGNCQNNNQFINLYGASVHCNHFVLNYRGYVYSPAAGPLTVTVTGADNLVLAWVGAVAYHGWNRGNALVDITYNNVGSGYTRSYNVPTDHVYTPIRIMFAQGSGPYGFTMSVTASDGTVLFSADSAQSQYLVQYSCDGVSAPAYPAFGSEAP